MHAHPAGAQWAAAPGFVATSVCRRCGVVAPTHGASCEVCRQPLQSVRVAAPAQPVDQCWVAVRCGFTCNSCRFLAPLDALDADGAVECAHCGLRQRFDVDLWAQALRFAHSVGDLSGPAREGRNPHPTLWIGSENPHAPTGDTRTFEHENFGTLSVDASPGHPICERCLEPLAVTCNGRGSAQTSCGRCGDRATHRVSDAALAQYEGLAAAVSDEHRSDRPAATLTATAAGVVSLSCPSCGAPLDVSGAGGVQTCRYCHVTCIVPHKSLSRALRKTPEPTLFWLLFQGLSPERSELLHSPRKDDDGAGKKALKLLKLGRTKGIGNPPGVYEAPEKTGVNWAQLLLTLVLGAIALLLGFVVTRFVEI